MVIIGLSKGMEKKLNNYVIGRDYPGNRKDAREELRSGRVARIM